jgi:tetratricopeptide (TPR) repeat protein
MAVHSGRSGAIRKSVLAGLMLAAGTSLALAQADPAHRQCLEGTDPAVKVRACSTVIDRDPGAVWAYVSRGTAYIAKGEHEHAIRDLTIAIDLAPPNANVLMAGSYNNRAWAYLKAGKAEQGLPDAERSLQLRPDNTYALDTRAHIFEALGRREEAIADFRRVIALSPNDPNAADARKALERLGAQP